MKAITVDTLEDRFVISVDRSLIQKDSLLQFVENLRVEILARKVNFDDQLEKLDEEIKQSWWEENKDRFIPKEVQ